MLNGLRVLSITWVILGHTFFYSLNGPVQNVPGFPLELMDTFSFAFVLSAPFSVDIFFWLSGFLGAYILLTGMKKKKGRMVPFWMACLHRVLRLWPLYIATLLLFWGIMTILGDGPIYWNYDYVYSSSCNKYWWSHLIFINNFYPPG